MILSRQVAAILALAHHPNCLNHKQFCIRTNRARLRLGNRSFPDQATELGNNRRPLTNVDLWSGAEENIPV